MKNKYISIILILLVFYVLSRTTFHFLSYVNFSIIFYLLILSSINRDTYIYYAIIFGLHLDYLISSYIGLGVLFFLFLSLIKMFIDYKFDLKTTFSIILFSLLSILFYNLFLSSILGYNIFSHYPYILKTSIVDSIIYIVIYSFLELKNAFYSIKK